MTKSILPLIGLVALLVLEIHESFSQTVSQKEAASIAKIFISAKKSAVKAAVKAAELIPCQRQLPINKINPEIFIFNIDGGGFVIVSGDKSVTPIIAYSYESNIPDSGVIYNFDEWIGNNIKEIDYCRKNSVTATSAILAQWTNLYNQDLVSTHSCTKSVSPFILSTWEQSGFYNDECPSDETGEALVGCIATAMSQIMYYYRYPAKGNGALTYNSQNFGLQSVNFGNASYDYSQMFDKLLFPSNEVAKLNYHAGVSVRMDYGVDGSGSFTYFAAKALKENFNFSSDIAYKEKRDYNNNNWKQMLISNIDNGMPIIYTGSSEQSGGHAFICDGYDDEGYFHFNWGWGGTANGFFNIETLNPANQDFSNNCDAVFNIHPPTNSYSDCQGLTILKASTGTIEDGSGPIDNYKQGSNCSWLINSEENCMKYTIKFNRLDIASDDSIKIFAGEDSNGTLVGSYNGSSIPGSIIVNGHEVFIQFTSNETNQANGFLLTYTGIVPVTCSSLTTITQLTDTISDGNDDDFYGNNSLCRWRIKPEGAKSVTLHFLNFDIEDRYDYLRIIDANTNDIIADLSGNVIPEPITINSNNVTIMLRTNANICKKGFKLYYTVTTDIDEAPEDLTANIFPNPTSDFINVNTIEIVENGTLTVSDFTGKVVCNMNISDTKNISIPIGEFCKGIYVVKLITSKGNICKKIIVE